MPWFLTEFKYNIYSDLYNKLCTVLYLISILKLCLQLINFQYPYIYNYFGKYNFFLIITNNILIIYLFKNPYPNLNFMVAGMFLLKIFNVNIDINFNKP